jgi:hypothetical protein
MPEKTPAHESGKKEGAKTEVASRRPRKTAQDDIVRNCRRMTAEQVKKEGQDVARMTLEEVEAELEALDRERLEAKARAQVLQGHRENLLRQEALVHRLAGMKEKDLQAMGVEDAGLLAKVQAVRAARQAAKAGPDQKAEVKPVVVGVKARKE